MEMASLERQTLEMHTRGICLDEEDPGEEWTEENGWTDSEIFDNFQAYDDFWQEQNDILDDHEDYEVLEEVVSQLPNLKEIFVSWEEDDPCLHFIKRPFCRREEYRMNEGRASTWHFRAILKAVQAAGTRLRSICAESVHTEILDEKKFGLHDIIDLVGDVRSLDLMLDTTDEKSCLPSPPAVVNKVTEECRALVKTHTLRRVLDCMPLLGTLKLSFVDRHNSISHPSSPASLSDLIPPGRTWNNMKVINLYNVETDREELIEFLDRHKGSLESFQLDTISLASSSWRQLIPSLRSLICGTKIVPLVIGAIKGCSEDGMGTMERWWLGVSHYDYLRKPIPLGVALMKYLTCPKTIPGRKCLLGGNIMAPGEGAGGWEGDSDLMEMDDEDEDDSMEQMDVEDDYSSVGVDDEEDDSVEEMDDEEDDAMEETNDLDRDDAMWETDDEDEDDAMDEN